MPLDPTYLVDIARACRLIMEFSKGMDEPAFLQDAKTQSAIIHQLLIIGEAVKRLSQSFRSAHPEIPWSAVSRMRDKMIHHYEVIDLHEVWDAASKGVPDMLRCLEPLLPPPETAGPNQ